MSTCAYVAAPSTRAPRTCSRCGARGHDVRSCTLTPPSADALLAAEDHDADDLDEADAEIAAEATEGDASAWDPDDMPTAPPATTVPAPKHRARPRLVEKASPAPAPLRVLLFASADGGVTVEAHEIATDPTEAAEIIDAWDKPAVLARGRRLVHVSPRVPTGLVIAAARHLRGAA